MAVGLSIICRELLKGFSKQKEWLDHPKHHRIIGNVFYPVQCAVMETCNTYPLMGTMFAVTELPIPPLEC